MTKKDMPKSSSHTQGPDATSQDEHRYLLGQILVDLGYITIYQLDEALQIQRADDESGIDRKPLGQILLELGFCGPNQLIRAIQVQSDLRKKKDSDESEES